jgi:regulatory protein
MATFRPKRRRNERTAAADHLPASEERERLAQACRDAALRFLSYRPRSVAEVESRLLRQGHAPEIVEATLTWLHEYELVDDEAFAAFWTESRTQFRPSGQRLIRAELAQRGVPADLAREAVAAVDEEDGAYRAAAKRATRWSREDELDFRRKLGSFLQRRGFDHDVVLRTVERVWRETPVA